MLGSWGRLMRVDSSAVGSVAAPAGDELGPEAGAQLASRCRESRYTSRTARAIGLSTYTGTSGMAAAPELAQGVQHEPVRSTANAGMTTEPPRATVRVMASASSSWSGSCGGWLRSPYVDSTTTARAAGGVARGSRTGWAGRPRSPENSTVVSAVVRWALAAAEDVPGAHQHEGALAAEGDRGGVRGLVEEPHGPLHVTPAVERHRWVVLGVAARARVRRLLLEQVRAVAQDDRREVGRSARAPDGAVESLSYQRRQVAEVVEVGVGEHHLVDGVGPDREGLPVEAPPLPFALVEAAVHEGAPAGVLHQGPAPGDRARRAEERQHGAHRWFPPSASPAPMVGSLRWPHGPGRERDRTGD